MKNVQISKLKSIRKSKRMTQQEAADRIGVSLRSYVSYENDPAKEKSIRYSFLLQELEKIDPLDEEHGVLSGEEITKICSEILSEYDVDYCYLFGSYAKGKASGKSDVDLLLGTKITGLRFFELVERLREGLHKKVDVLDLKQVMKNEELLNEILKDGIRVYG